MRTVSRPYQPGDETQINALYRLVSGRERGADEFAWEWLHTWAGQGSMNLLFDLDREEGDQLIAQYSLIPTPLSVWGRPMLAGKTENCMSHPDCRGTGLYSKHEREHFEKEKQKYSFFYTTAGQVAGGAAGKVRMKLGYLPFGNWVLYTLWLRTGALRDDIGAFVAARGALGGALAPALGGLLAPVLQAYSHLRRRHACGYRVEVHGEGAAPLDEIARLWERNRALYGVSVDRRADFLRWRIDEDPHIRHEYLTMRDDGGLLGYAVFFLQDGTLHVVDVVVDGAGTALFRHLFAAVCARARELGAERVQCRTLRGSYLLPRRVKSAGFADVARLSPAGFVNSFRRRQFFVYVPEEWRDDPTVADRGNWYVTELFLEGLPRPTEGRSRQSSA